MKYYLLEGDKKAAEVPELLNFHQKVDERNLVPERYHLIPDITVLFGRFAPNSSGNELILEPALLLPQKAARILSKFEPNMKYKDMPLVDQEKGKMEKYVFPLLKSCDCLNEKTVLNQDKSVIIEGYLTREAIPDQVLFRLDGVTGQKVVARQDFVECLLKRYLLGFHTRELVVKEE